MLSQLTSDFSEALPFNGQVRDKRLNENWFQAMDDGRSNVEAWRQDYINKSYNGR